MNVLNYMTIRTNGPSYQWAFGLMVLRTNGQSPFWRSTNFTYFDSILKSNILYQSLCICRQLFILLGSCRLFHLESNEDVVPTQLPCTVYLCCSIKRVHVVLYLCHAYPLVSLRYDIYYVSKLMCLLIFKTKALASFICTFRNMHFE